MLPRSSFCSCFWLLYFFSCLIKHTWGLRHRLVVGGVCLSHLGELLFVTPCSEPLRIPGWILRVLFFLYLSFSFIYYFSRTESLHGACVGLQEREREKVRRINSSWWELRVFRGLERNYLRGQTEVIWKLQKRVEDKCTLHEATSSRRDSLQGRHRCGGNVVVPSLQLFFISRY